MGVGSAGNGMNGWPLLASQPPATCMCEGGGRRCRCWWRVRGQSSALPLHAGPDVGGCAVRGRRRTGRRRAGGREPGCNRLAGHQAQSRTSNGSTAPVRHSAQEVSSFRSASSSRLQLREACQMLRHRRHHHTTDRPTGYRQTTRFNTEGAQ